MSFENIDEYRVEMVKGYAKAEYYKGYEAGKKDAVKHGHWIVYPTLVSFLRCSQCHNGVGWHNDKKPNYCPHCGARMDGDAND